MQESLKEMVYQVRWEQEGLDRYLAELVVD